MTLRIDGVGTAVPQHRLTQVEAAELHANFCLIDDKRARTLRALYRRSGIDTRGSVLLFDSGGPLETRQRFYPRASDDDDRGPTTAVRMEMYEAKAPPLAITAARRALGAGGVAPSDVTHLITVSCTGFVSPGVDSAIIDALGLDRTTQRTNVGFMGCHGALNGLRAARSFVESDSAAVPLVCAVELCTLHFAYGWDPDMLVANALFADGAAALVGRDGGRRPDRAGSDRVDPSSPDQTIRSASRPWHITATGTYLMEASEEAMTWRVGDHGFRMTLSPEVPALIEENLRTWLTDWLADQGLSIDDVRSWAVHPGGPRILTAVQRTLGLTRDDTAASRAILADHGNMSSPTILFILDRMRAQGAPLPCVALAFGPGLAVEVSLFT
jgi:predicted naringenin-chalcone synthase